MRVEMIRDKAEVSNDGEVKPVNSLPGRQLALVGKLYEAAAFVAQCSSNAEAYADLMTVVEELMRINEVDTNLVVVIGIEKAERLGGFRKGLIWSREVPDRTRKSAGYRAFGAENALKRAMNRPDN